MDRRQPGQNRIFGDYFRIGGYSTGTENSRTERLDEYVGDCVNSRAFPATTGQVNESYQRGCQEKFFPLPPPKGDRCCRLHPAQASLDGSTRRFHEAMLFDAFGSGSCASKHVGFGGPTMVLSETRGLQLFGVMQGGIWCI